MKRIVQTAGRNALEEFSPEFAHFNDDVLFGENWNHQDIDLKTRSINVFRNNGFIFNISFTECKGTWCDTKGNCSNHYSCCILCRLAKRLGSFSSCKRSICKIFYRTKLPCSHIHRSGWYFQRDI